jgi:hypothetical protein
MANGIIISTQTPEDKTTFPRQGGTAFAINKATDLPIVHMHRDAKARKEELSAYGGISDKSTVYISGHGDTEGDELTGGYINLGENIRNSHDWTLQQYRDLIVSNSSLKRGDSITVVLWACYGGKGGKDSTAAKLANLLKESGINSRIIASTKPLLRFNGSYDSDESPESKLRFRTYYASEIRVFEMSDKGLTKSRVKEPIYIGKNGVGNVNLLNTKHYPTHLVLDYLTDKSLYKSDYSKEKGVRPYLNENVDFILRPSNSNKSSNVFTASFFLSDDDILNTRFRIDDSGTLEVQHVDKTWGVLPRNEAMIETAIGRHVNYRRQIANHQLSQNLIIEPLFDDGEAKTLIQKTEKNLLLYSSLNSDENYFHFNGLIQKGLVFEKIDFKMDKKGQIEYCIEGDKTWNILPASAEKITLEIIEKHIDKLSNKECTVEIIKEKEPQPTKKQQTIDSFNTILDDYMHNRQRVVNSKGSIKQYVFGFFTFFQYSYTDKMNAVAAIRKAISNEQAIDSQHIGALKNGKLAKSVNDFLKQNDTSALLGENVETIDGLIAHVNQNSQPTMQQVNPLFV